ncbi:hypothetical protein GCM10025879_12230 [Leuconostoc litchii]|uniref:XRE family transcriptional regulator n=1 Tax=Leuconostoc litchii TaxID=1981069 RepID=A0A6P2CMT6_9LACO|nr:helix-turn-helix transcriptional regulator [Leuconostoc litchii]TYC46265.1 XRE family transcriptional regulator [Leuconostoc litchii]GMA69977.1 hypothetical protein GCM10025879_12230 [Leuconostoc litchii]
MKIIFAENLLVLRKEHNLSQEGLANQLFVTRQTISKWELGEVTPDLNKIQSIAEFFDLPVENLLFGDSIRNIEDPLIKESVINQEWNGKRLWQEWQMKPINNF